MSGQVPDIGGIADGLALWEEHKPQSGEDWVAVAECFIAAGETTEKSSPLFAALVLAVEQRDAGSGGDMVSGLKIFHDALPAMQASHEQAQAIDRAFEAAAPAICKAERERLQESARLAIEEEARLRAVEVRRADKAEDALVEACADRDAAYKAEDIAQRERDQAAQQERDRIQKSVEALPRLEPTSTSSGGHYEEHTVWEMVETKSAAPRPGRYLRRDAVLASLQEGGSSGE